MSLPKRKKTETVRVRSLAIGSDHPIAVQSMTNTDTADAERTAEQITELHGAGSEMVRITVNNKAAAAKVREIRERLTDAGIDVPLIGDFHYNGHVLLREFPDCAEALDKFRINPGNVGRGAKHDENFATMIEVAKDHDRPVRIGVNAGSLDPELLTEMMTANNAAGAPQTAAEVMLDAMVESAMSCSAAAQEIGLKPERIILSCKISKVPELIEVYRKLSARSSHPLHLGLTEAGMGTKGTVATTAALAVLLREGIGDTIRASLTPPPGGSRSEEVRVARAILQATGIRPFLPEVTACPGCGRTTSSYFQVLTQEVESFLEERMPIWRVEKPQVAQLKVAVMGCVVNGPGESRVANIGISLPGTGEAPRSPVYVDGEHRTTLEGPNLSQDFKQLIENYVASM